MKNKRKVLLNALFFLLVLGLTIYGVLHGENLGEVVSALGKCRVSWLIPAVACVLAFIWGESIIIWYMLRSCGIPMKERRCFLISSVGFFFSCVTPSASGGQPMQIYFMRKDKIPIPIATVILMIVTITYKLVLVVIGVGILLFARPFLEEYLCQILWIFYLGIALNVACVAFMLLLVFHPFLARAILQKGLKLLERMHVLRHKEGRLARLDASMDQYGQTADFMKNHKGMMFRVFVITFFQRVALFSVTYLAYRAFGLSGWSWLTITTMQAVISVSVDMLPLPGGMGISESLFMILFAPVFGELLLPGMIVSRGLGYYSELLVSALFTLAAVVVYGRAAGKASSD